MKNFIMDFMINNNILLYKILNVYIQLKYIFALRYHKRPFKIIDIQFFHEKTSKISDVHFNLNSLKKYIGHESD